jgi:hypothetical protein
MNDNIRELIYRSGMEPSWNELDIHTKESVIRLIEHTILDCVIIYNYGTAYRSPDDYRILNHYGVK